MSNALLWLMLVLFSLIFASFFASLSYRLPTKINNANSQTKMAWRSFCPHCTKTLSTIMLIPIVSYCYQKGKCCYCREKIDSRYLLVELSCLFVSLVVVYYFGWQWQSLALLFLCYCLITLFVIDWQTQLLPDQLTLPLLAVGLMVNTSGIALVNTADAIIGALTGYVFLWLLAWLFRHIRKREVMGYGDFKLTAALGAWFGWQALPYLLLVSSLAGIVFALIFLRKNYNQAFAFGPFLITAAFVWLFYHSAIF